MPTTKPNNTADDNPLAGCQAWLITDGKMGSDRQAEGVATALGMAAQLKHVAPRGVFRLMAPFGPPDPRDRFAKPGGQFAPPWPDIAIAIGRRSAPYLRALKNASPSTFTVILLDPRAGLGIADLIWVPEHDTLRGPNVMTTPTSPHPFTPERLRQLRASMSDDIAALPYPRIAVLLGGRNGSYRYTDAEHAAVQTALKSLADWVKPSFMISDSRRTHPELLEAVLFATEGSPRLVNDGNPNRYPEFLAHADRIIVTADSVNMTGEAAATGTPVYVFTPEGGRAKFQRFHAVLAAHGATKPLAAALEDFSGWSYPPIDSTGAIASQIAQRFKAHRLKLDAA